jgi:hypothetical protein
LEQLEGTHAALDQPEEECMTRRITAAAIAAIAAVGIASVATAASDHAATPYKASLKATSAAATAGVGDVVGKAQLVDGKKNKASLHMRNLAAGTVYLWHVHFGTCADTPPGMVVPGWTYRTQVGANGTLTSNEAGNGNTKGTSATFNAAPGTSYSVNVHVSVPTNGLAPGTIIACGDLKVSKASGKSTPKKPHPAQAKGPKS